ncbi:SDR family NAD(P)-dependent oxidoreductase [Nocardia vinacea]|uniref:SDR family NAD(P)-dependent oxidoreductase n=1 Tax=Nocardia vinacea TaxID=96468 RepID=UPI0034495365
MSESVSRTIVFVGATSGMGRHAVRRLARDGHRLILIGRDPRRTAELRAELPDATVITADVATAAGIDRAAAQIVQVTDTVDTLVNNAGVMVPDREVTAEGVELNFAVHHLAPFSMTGVLLSLLQRGAGRVVNVNSEGHRAALFHSGAIALDFADLGSERHYDPFLAYSRSKLANLLFSCELQRRHPELAIVALHPGMVRSDLGRRFSRLRVAPMHAISLPTAKGAAPIIELATSTDIESGAYYNRFKPVRSSPQSYEAATARRLWEVTEQLRGRFDQQPIPGRA